MVLSDFVIGIFVGAFFMGFIWLVILAIQSSQDQIHEVWICGRRYSTENAIRIDGVFQHRSSNGKWLCSINSLWRVDENHYFRLVIDELNHPEIRAMNKYEAQDWVNKNSSKEEARKIFLSWFSE